MGDAFASHPECKGHTGDLAMSALVGLPCSAVPPGYVADQHSCKFDEKGADTLITFFPGMSFAVKDACPEKCGNPCAHAPTEDVVAGVMKDFKKDLTLDCPGAKAAGLCESDLLVNWFCGESCRGGGPWDECMWHTSARQQIDQDCADPAKNAAYGYEGPEACEADSVANYIGTGYTKTARQQIDDDCAAPAFLQKYGYGGNNPTAECVADSVANYIGTSTGTCPGDTSGTGADCYKDKNLSTCPGDISGANCYYDKNLFDYGSTQVAQCTRTHLDPFRRRKLTRSGTHSDAMKTKGVFTLTASGSK